MKSISNTIESTTYQVWVLGYDENGDITDFEVLVNECKDAERMIDEIKYIEILGETVVNFEDYTENVETLFSKIVKVK